MDGFKDQFGTTQCGDLTAQWVDDFANPARAYRCGELVRYTLERLTHVLDSPQESPDWQDDWWSNYLRRRDKVE
jgi:hypothetical protein